MYYVKGPIGRPSVMLEIDQIKKKLNKKKLYADNTVIDLSGKNTLKVKKTLQKNINKFVEWCEINQLTINIKTTKVMVFGTRHYINKSKKIELSIGEELLQ